MTSVATLGSETMAINSPGPSMMTYGTVKPDNTMEILLHRDHRIYDGVRAERVLQKLEDVLNGVRRRMPTGGTA